MAAGLGEAASIAGIISLAGQTLQAITTITAFCKAYKNVHIDIARASTSLELLRRVLLQIETTATFSLVPSRCPPALISHLRDCVSKCREDLHVWIEWTKKVDLGNSGSFEKVWKRVKVAADRSQFSRLSDGVSGYIEHLTLSCQLLNCDLNFQNLNEVRHVNRSVETLQVSQDDFQHEALHEMSQVTDAMSQLKVSNEEGMDSLRSSLQAVFSTTTTSNDISRRYQSMLEHMRTEFRDQLLEIRGQLDEYQKAVQYRQTIIQSSYINTDLQVTGIQLTQALSVLGHELRIDHAYSLRSQKFGRSRRQRDSNPTGMHFCHSRKLQAWSFSEVSSLIMIQAKYSGRFAIQGFCIDVIQTLQTAGIPTLWALRARGRSIVGISLTATDVFKSLTFQALYLNTNCHTESSLASKYAAVRDATGLDTMSDILASVLNGLPQVYIIIDVELFTSFQEKIIWPSAFNALFLKLSNHGSTSVVKVILVSYTANTFLNVADLGFQERVVCAEGRTGPAETARKNQNSRKGLQNAGMAWKNGLGLNSPVRKLLLKGHA